MLSLLLALTACPQGGVQHYFLDVADLELGSATATPADEYLGLVPGHALEFRISGTPGQPVAVLIARDVGPPDPWIPGLLEVSASAAAVPGAVVLDGDGQGVVRARVPVGLPAGVPLRSQALGPDPGRAGAASASNSIAHETTLLEPRRLASGVKTGHPLASTGGLLKIEDQAAWEAFWDLHDAGTPPLPLPPVDFEREVVVASFYGLVGTTGYSIGLDAIDVAPGALTVQQVLHTPGPGCGGGFAVGFPHLYLALDRVAAGADLSATTALVPGSPCP